MDIRAIAFDVNGTLIEILTDEGMDQIFRAAGHYLTYQGIDLRRFEVRDLYFQTLKAQQKNSPETYPEFDAVGVWRSIVQEHMTDYTKSLPAEKVEQIPLFLAEMYRGISRRRLCLYPHILGVLEILRGRFPLAIVTDAQSAYARPELNKAGLLGYFSPIVVSGDFGFRKPDKRLFQTAIDGLGVPAENILYVGNDMHRDIYGAREAGMKTLMFNSDQGTKEYQGVTPDFTITDYREMLALLDLPAIQEP